MPRKTLGESVAEAYAVAVAARALAEAAVAAKLPYRTVAKFVRASLRDVAARAKRPVVLVDDWEDLSLRAAHVCQSLGIRTIDELAGLTPTTLRDRGASVRTIRELSAKLATAERLFAVRTPADRMLLRGPIAGGKTS